MKFVTKAIMLAAVLLIGLGTPVDAIEVWYKSLNHAGCTDRWADYSQGNFIFHEAEDPTTFICGSEAWENCRFKFWTFSGTVDDGPISFPRYLGRSHTFESSGSDHEGPHPTAWYWCSQGGPPAPPHLTMVAINIDTDEVITLDWIAETNPDRGDICSNGMTCGTPMEVGGNPLVSVTAELTLPDDGSGFQLEFVQWDLDYELQWAPMVEGETTRRPAGPELEVGAADRGHFAVAYYRYARMEIDPQQYDLCDVAPNILVCRGLIEAWPELLPVAQRGAIFTPREVPLFLPDICRYVRGGIENCPGCDGGIRGRCGGMLNMRGLRDEVVVFFDRKTRKVLQWDKASKKRLDSKGNMGITISQKTINAVGGLDKLSMMILPGKYAGKNRPQKITMDWKPH